MKSEEFNHKLGKNQKQIKNLSKKRPHSEQNTRTNCEKIDQHPTEDTF